MKKLDYQTIKQEFEKEGYQLLSTEYINSYTHILCICPMKHQYKTTYSNWQQGHRCSICFYENRKIQYEQVKQSFEKEGYQLLSKEYINNSTPLEFICPNGHKHKIQYSNWQSGQRCRKCVKSHNKLTYKQIKESFEKDGYKLLSHEYKDAHQYLDFICPSGHKHKITYSAYKQGQRCGLCDIKWSKGEKEIVEYIKNNYSGVIKENDRTLIQNPKTGKYLELDIWLPEVKKAIEYNGEYYHSDKYTKWKDLYKKYWCEENGIELLIINHKEWLKNKNWNAVKSLVM